jgi:hypothetical protein
VKLHSSSGSRGFRGSNSGYCVCVRRVVVRGGPVGFLARVFEHNGFARHNLYRAQLESLVRHAYDDTILVVVVGEPRIGLG